MRRCSLRTCMSHTARLSHLLALALAVGFVAPRVSAQSASAPAPVATATAPAKPRYPKTVVWIQVDTLRADALGCYGFTQRGENDSLATPNIDTLASESLRFTHAYSAAPWTIPSFVTQFSGLWPFEHEVTGIFQECQPAHLPLIPALGTRGWRTVGIMTNFVATSDWGFAHGFDIWDDSLASGHVGVNAQKAVEKALAYLDQPSDPEAELEPAGTFLFVWLFDPHYRYEPHDGLRFGPGHGDLKEHPYAGKLTSKEKLDDLQKNRANLSADDIAFLRGNYASEVANMDRAVGTLVSALKERKLYDDALIVVSADHGEEILDRGWLGHSVTLYDELVRVPLLFRLPNGTADPRRGKSIAHPVSLIDLGATLVDLMSPTKVDREQLELGHSRSFVPTLLRDEKPERRWLYLHTNFEPVVKEGANPDRSALQWGVFDAERGLKWIVDHKVEAGAAPRTALFDVLRDPSEHTNLAGTEGAAAQILSLQRLRGLVPKLLAPKERGAPYLLPEEPWMPDTEAAREHLGPAWSAEKR